MSDWLAKVRFNEDGLIAVIAVDAQDNTVLMQAWMNANALEQTVASGVMVYYSRSRGKLWRKGESSGHTQKVVSLWLDCDGDALVAKVEQVGGIACHTGRRSCFYQRLDNGQWHNDAPVLKNPEDIYGG